MTMSSRSFRRLSALTRALGGLGLFPWMQFKAIDRSVDAAGSLRLGSNNLNKISLS